MSIPKEPRQLMINLMYLVLTSLLALNVSAEIFNAFKVVNRGLDQANNSIDSQNNKLPESIKKFAQKDMAAFGTYAARADKPKQIVQPLVELIDNTTREMIEKSGGFSIDKATGQPTEQPAGYKNKDITTRMLVMEGRGKEIEDMIGKVRGELLQLVDEKDRATFENKMTLGVSEDWKKSKDKKSWAEFNFKQMPLLATMPILNKIKNDAKSGEAAILNYLMGKIGQTDNVVFDKFKVMAAPKSSYVIMGDKFEADVFLSSTTKETKGLSIAVNGGGLPVTDGVAKYTAVANGLGVKKYSATVSVKNAVTGKVESYTGNFEYEVGLRSATVTAKKMNVFYIGVPNPVAVSAAGISSNALKVSASGAGISLNKTGNTEYEARVTQQGDATISLSGPGLQATNFPFRAKRIPNPTPKLGKEAGGSLGNGTFKAQDGLIAELENFDFDARCNIEGFNLVRVAKRADPQQSANVGGRFSGEARRLVDMATPGDRYYFENIRARCPGDQAGRKLGEMVFTIK